MSAGVDDTVLRDVDPSAVQRGASRPAQQRCVLVGHGAHPGGRRETLAGPGTPARWHNTGER